MFTGSPRVVWYKRFKVQLWCRAGSPFRCAALSQEAICCAAIAAIITVRGMGTPPLPPALPLPPKVAQQPDCIEHLIWDFGFAVGVGVCTYVLLQTQPETLPTHSSGMLYCTPQLAVICQLVDISAKPVFMLHQCTLGLANRHLIHHAVFKGCHKQPQMEQTP